MRFVRRFTTIGALVTIVDIGLFLVLRSVVGWPVIVADVIAITVAAVASYWLHRAITYAAEPARRWYRDVRHYVAAATFAGLVDLAVLLVVAGNSTAVLHLLIAKLAAVVVAFLIRLVSYRQTMFDVIRSDQGRDPERGPAPGEVRLSLVIPAYCEEAGIAATVDRVEQALGHLRDEGGFELIVVDDGSPDDTSSAARDAGADVVITLERNQGKGAAVRAGMLAARGRSVAFTDADLDTGLIERSRDFLFPAGSEPPRNVFFVAAVAGLLREQAAAVTRARHSGEPWSPWSSHDGWRLNIQSQRTLTYRSGDSVHEVAVAYEADGWRLTLRGESVLARGRVLESGRFAGQLAVELDDRRLVASVVAVNEKEEQKRYVFLNGTNYLILRDDPLHLVEAGGRQGGGLTAPMPGKVVALLAAVGQQVDKGAPLLILEAMKMEHTITAPKNGTVKAFCYAAGDQVADGAELVDFAAEQ